MARSLDEMIKEDAGLKRVIEINLPFLELLKHVPHGHINNGVAWKDSKLQVGKITAQVEGV